MTELTADARNDLPASDFVFPGSRKYPIHNLSHARNALARAAGKPEEAAVKAAVHKRYPSLQKSEDIEIRSPLWKDDAQQIVWGVVLTPGLEDSQGDVAPAEEIQKAAHSFLADYRAQDIQHSGVNADIVPVESFIAPCDFPVTDPTGKVQMVLKGAWVLASKVNDPEAWESVQKGERTGWSIEGSAFREPITA